MGEKLGFLFTIAIFAMSLLPLGLDAFTFNVRTSQFLNAATEMQQVVKEEGGITDRVHYINDNSSISYTFKNKDGQIIDGKQDVGEVIYIEYQYDWKGIYTQKTFKTINTVLVDRR